MIEKHDKRLLDSAINATNMDGQDIKENYGNFYGTYVNHFGNPE